MIAFQPQSKLVMWPCSWKLQAKARGSREDKWRHEVVELEPWDVVIFRGDLFHAGAAYEQQNLRAHIYMDAPGTSRQKKKEKKGKKFQQKTYFKLEGHQFV